MALIVTEDYRAIDTSKVEHLNITTLQAGGTIEVHANLGLIERGDYENYQMLFKGAREQALFVFNQITEIWYKDEVYVIPKARKLTVEDEKREYHSLLYIKDKDIHIFISEKSNSYVAILIRIKDRRYPFIFTNQDGIEHGTNNEQFKALLNDIGLNSEKQEELKTKIHKYLPTGE